MLRKAYKKEASMTPPIWDNGFDVHIGQIFTDMILMLSTKEDNRDNPARIEKQGNPISLTELLRIIKSTNSCRVLITGKAGMGKTTLLKYIAYNWATYSGDTFADKLLFLVNVRDIEENHTLLDVIVQQYIDMEDFYAKTDLQRDSKIIQTYLRKHDDELMFLLDGLDELKPGSKGPEKLFDGLELENSKVILTSRPERTNNVLKMCDVHVNVEGFGVSQMKQSIHKYFNFFNKSDSGESLIIELRLDSINENECGDENHHKAFKLCSSPLLLLHICTVWKQKNYLPNDLTDLYKEIFVCILNQYIGRRNDEEKVTFDSIPHKYFSAILVLGETIYEGLHQNQLYIDKTSLTKVHKKDIVDLALKIGFVYKEQPVAVNDHSKIYSTPHKLLSESLAGFYLSTKCQQTSLHDNEYEKLRSSEYLHMTKAFAIGFLGKNAGKLMKHWLGNNATNYYSLAVYFEYVKTENQINVIQTLEDHTPEEMKQDVKMMTESFQHFLNIDDIFLLNRPSNKHLVQLMADFLNNYSRNPNKVGSTILSLINRSSEQESESICRTVAHLSLLLQMEKGFWSCSDYLFSSKNDMYLFHVIEKWGDKAIMVLSNVWDKHNLKDEISYLDLRDPLVHINMSLSTFCKIFKLIPKLKLLELASDETLFYINLEQIIHNCRVHGNRDLLLIKNKYSDDSDEIPFSSMITQVIESDYSPGLCVKYYICSHIGFTIVMW